MSPKLATFALCSYIAVSGLLVFFFPHSVIAFLLVEASLLLLFYLPAPDRVKMSLGALVLRPAIRARRARRTPIQ